MPHHFNNVFQSYFNYVICRKIKIVKFQVKIFSSCSSRKKKLTRKYTHDTMTSKCGGVRVLSRACVMCDEFLLVVK